MRSLVLLVVTLLVMVFLPYFGFHLKGFRFQTKIDWLDSGVGRNFRGHTVGYTDGIFPTANPISDSGLTIERAVESGFSGNSGSAFP
jgi:hypothetical protein